MSEFLSKEEIKQWRSSLEKITLEEYAARLGKTVEEEKQTNDIVDIVLKGQPVMSKIDAYTQTRGEKLTSIAQRAFDREREISHTPFAVPSPDKKIQENKVKKQEKSEKIEKPSIIAAKAEKQTLKTSEVSKDSSSSLSLQEEVRLVFSKALTEREQLVFDYFAKNKNKIVYAKDLAKLLDLPRDYVYKYIKNLRAKIEGDKLQNADNGGYVLAI